MGNVGRRSDPVQTWQSTMLDYLDQQAEGMVKSLVDVVRVPSISGSDEDNSLQSEMATQLDGLGLEVDHWQIPSAQTHSTPDFPGVEVERSEAWGLVCELPNYLVLAVTGRGNRQQDQSPEDATVRTGEPRPTQETDLVS